MAEEEEGLYPPALWSEDFSGTPGTNLEDLGFSLYSNRGYATISDDGALKLTYGIANYFITTWVNRITTTQPPSSSGDPPWTKSSSSMPVPTQSTLVMPDGSTNGYQTTFRPATEGVSYIASRFNSETITRGKNYNVSVWACTPPGAGSTTMRMYAYRSSSSGSTFQAISEDIVIDETMRRVNANVAYSGTGSISEGTFAKFYFGFANGSTYTNTPIILWGAQVSNVDTMQPFRVPASWASNWYKDTGVANHSVECDVLAPTNGGRHLVLRAGASSCNINYNTTGVMINHYSGIDGYGIANPIPYTGEVPFRLRAEVVGQVIYIYTGPVGVPYPLTPLGNANGYTMKASWSTTGTGAGFGIHVNSTLGVIADNYVAREAKRFITVKDARSETRSDVILPLNYSWIEDFTAAPGTALVDLGFDFQTTEVNGDPRKAIVGSNQKLNIQLSSQSAAIWTKPVGSRDHFIEATIYSKPRATMQAPMIIRAAGPEHWIGLWIDDSKGYDRVVLGYRYASTIHEYHSVRVTTSPDSAWSFPIKVKIEAKAHYVYLYYFSTDLNAFWPVEPDGWYIDENETPIIYESGNGYRTGIARIGDSSSTDISSFYRSGTSLIAGTTVTPRQVYSETREDKAVLNGPTISEGRKSYSNTFADKAGSFATSLVDGTRNRSETFSDVGGAYPEAGSVTRSDKACVSTDKIVVNKAFSGTTADTWHEPATVQDGSKALSETFSDTTEASVHTWIFESGLDYYPEEFARPPKIFGARSTSRIVGRAPINGNSNIDPDVELGEGEDGGVRGSTSRTYADKPVITKFVWATNKPRSETYSSTPYAAIHFYVTPDKARSPTRALGTGGSSDGSYRPWLFT